MEIEKLKQILGTYKLDNASDTLAYTTTGYDIKFIKIDENN